MKQEVGFTTGHALTAGRTATGTCDWGKQENTLETQGRFEWKSGADARGSRGVFALSGFSLARWPASGRTALTTGRKMVSWDWSGWL